MENLKMRRVTIITGKRRKPIKKNNKTISNLTMEIATKIYYLKSNSKLNHEFIQANLNIKGRSY